MPSKILHPDDGSGPMARTVSRPRRPRYAGTGLARVSRVLLAVLGLTTLLSGGAVPLHAQTPPPDAEWWTFETEHFRLTFPPRLEPMAREAAEVAERVHGLLEEELAPAPGGPIDIVLTDHLDVTNGSATPFPSNRIVLYARPPLDLPSLAYSRDWIELVVAHELVHIFHLDVTGSVGRGIRAVLGRVPLLWPVFPVLGTPAWSIEGLATHYESRLTGAGRVHGSFHEMVVRTAALEEEIPDLGRVSAPSPVWPAGQRSYVYGASFMRWLAGAFGADVHRRLVEETATAGLPPFLFFGRVAEDVTGQDFEDLYDAWRDQAVRKAHETRDSVAARGLTESEPVPGAGSPSDPFAVWPRISPDGSRLAFSADDFRSEPATRLVDLATGEVSTVARRNQAATLLGPAAWLPDGSALITAQLEFDGPYRVRSDLWRVGLDGSETRLTRGARLERPDVAPDGRRVVAVQNRDGAMPLVILDLVSGFTESLATAVQGEGFTTPRWSPDGRTVAASRFTDGRTDLVLVDVASGTITPLTDDDALDLAPAWTPDGSAVVFWSDRSGIPNLYAVDTGPRPRSLRQVTNVLGGAFDPDVSPDGRWIYFSAYHAGGWRLERLPFQPETWRPASPPALAYGAALLDATDPAPADDSAAPPPQRAPDPQGPPLTAAPPADHGPLTRYSPWPTVRPTFWIPSFFQSSAADDHLDFLGIFSMGWDVLQQHQWEATVAVDVGSGRLAIDGAWRWRGLGMPELTLALARDWDAVGAVEVEPGDVEGLWLVENRIGVDALWLRRAWRATAWAQAGADIQGRSYDLHRGGSEGDEILEDVGAPDLPTALGLRVGAGWGNARAFPYSISLQDGISASVSARRWWTADGLARTYDQAQARLAGYRGFRWWGFADHVTAARVSALGRFGPGALPTAIGGAAGGAESLLGTSIGGTGLFLPVRGYDDGDRSGTRAWTASLEYRAPLLLTGWRGDIFGLSITALSGTLFADAGDAWCDEPLLSCRTTPGDPLLSAGAELSIDFGVLHSVPLRVRGGFAVPFTDVDPDDGRPGPDIRNWRLHLVFGPSF